MASGDASGDDDATAPTERSAPAGGFNWLADHPWQTLALGIAAAVILAYAVLVRQELLPVVWLALAALVVHLALRFVRAVERIAAASERLAGSPE